MKEVDVQNNNDDKNDPRATRFGMVLARAKNEIKKFKKNTFPLAIKIHRKVEMVFFPAACNNNFRI